MDQVELSNADQNPSKIAKVACPERKRLYRPQIESYQFPPDFDDIVICSFVESTRTKKSVKSLRTDAFYGGVKYEEDIALIEKDPALRRTMECESLRRRELEFVHMSRELLREIGEYESVFVKMLVMEFEDERMVKSVLLLESLVKKRMRRLELFHSLREQIIETYFIGENCWNTFKRICYVANKFAKN